MSAVQLDVVGKNVLRVGNKAFVPERKTAALLTYLALEGPTTRSRIAGLLWPDSEEATARNNLSQLLRRLKGLLSGEFIYTEGTLQLSELLEVDAAQLKADALSGNAEQVVKLYGDLLGTHDYDDLPEFDEWLWSTREALHAFQKDALESLVSSLEAQGKFRAALSYAERLIESEPLSEVAHRHAMRLNYLIGDRLAAIRVYARLKETLAREVNVEPLPETKDLARSIERGEVQFPTVVRAREIPVEMLRPPVLVGRESAWARMSEAWDKGQYIVLSGEPGIGKTRLATDFASSKGQTLSLEGRPGDVVVPFSTAVRNVRRILAHAQDVKIEPWVQRALTPLLPELGESSPVIAGAGTHQGGSSLLEAVRRVLQVGSHNLDAFVYDDLQFADNASIEAGFYIISSHFPLGGPDGFPHWISCFRTGELSAHTEDILRRLVAAGQAVIIELEPLNEMSIGGLLTGLDLHGKSALSSRLTHLTGGNPLYILETIRHLYEKGYSDEDLPDRILPPGKVGSVIRRRLERLSPTALRIAQAAAVLQSDFDPALVGELLNLDALALLDPWDELERAQVLKPNRFAHDLIYETVRESISPSVVALLHRRAAEVLTTRRANPLRVARHWLEAGDNAAALDLFLEAADIAKEEGRMQDADDICTQAGDILDKLGRGEERTQLLNIQAELSVRNNSS